MIPCVLVARARHVSTDIWPDNRAPERGADHRTHLRRSPRPRVQVFARPLRLIVVCARPPSGWKHSTLNASYSGWTTIYSLGSSVGSGAGPCLSAAGAPTVDRLQKALVIGRKRSKACFHHRNLSVRCQRPAYHFLLVDELNGRS